MDVSYGIGTTKRLKPLELRGKKIKRQIWKLTTRPHSIFVQNLYYNFDVCLDMRISKFGFNFFRKLSKPLL